MSFQAFDEESKINADLGDDPAMIYFFRLYIQNVNEEFIDILVHVEETNRYVTVGTATKTSLGSKCGVMLTPIIACLLKIYFQMI